MLKEQLSIGDEQVNSVDPLNIQPESLDSLQFLEYSNDRDHLVQPTTIYQRPENNKLERCYGGNFGAQYNAKNDSNKLERCYGGYVGAEYHSSNLMLVKNDSGTPKLYSIGFFLSISSLYDVDTTLYSKYDLGNIYKLSSHSEFHWSLNVARLYGRSLIYHLKSCHTFFLVCLCMKFSLRGTEE